MSASETLRLLAGIFTRHHPGDRNDSSTTTDYKRALRTGTATRADIGTTETLITASPAVLIAVIPNALNAGNIEIRNAASTGGGATADFVLDLSPGEPVDIGAEMDAGITVDGTDAATDCTIIWAPL